MSHVFRGRGRGHAAAMAHIQHPTTHRGRGRPKGQGKTKHKRAGIHPPPLPPSSSPPLTTQPSSPTTLPSSSTDRRSTRPSTPVLPSVDFSLLSIDQLCAIACAGGLTDGVPVSWPSRTNLMDMVSNLAITSQLDVDDLIQMGSGIIQAAQTEGGHHDGSSSETPRGMAHGSEAEEEDATDKEEQIRQEARSRMLHDARTRTTAALSSRPSTLSHSLSLLVPSSQPIQSYSFSKVAPAPDRVGHDQTSIHLPGMSPSHSVDTEQVRVQGMESMLQGMIARAIAKERDTIVELASHVVRTHDAHVPLTHVPVVAAARPSFTADQLAYMQLCGMPIDALSPPASHLPPALVAQQLSSLPTDIPVVDIHALMGDQLRPFDPAVQLSLRNGTCYELDKYLRPRLIREEIDVIVQYAKEDGTIGQRKVNDKRVVLTMNDFTEAIYEECSLLTEHALVRDRMQFLALVTRLSMEYGAYAAIRYARVVIERQLSPLVGVTSPTIAQRCISALHDAAFRGLSAPAPHTKRKMSEGTTGTTHAGSSDATVSRPKRARSSASNSSHHTPSSSSSSHTSPLPRGTVSNACHSWNRGRCNRTGCKYEHICMWCGAKHAASTSDACTQKGGHSTPTGPGGPPGQGT